MSTALTLVGLEANPPRALVRYEPPLKGRQSYVRKLSIQADMYEWLHEPAKNKAAMELKQAILAHFRSFVLGDEVDDFHFMKRVEDRRVSIDKKFSAEVWSMRTHFQPQYRFFGFFALPNWFVILNKQSRRALDRDAKWHAEMDKALRIWGALLPDRQPHGGNVFSDLVTSNWEHCDERWYTI